MLHGMDAGLVALFRHHAWASDRLFAACEGLPADQLEFVVQGTFGGLGATLRHLVEAEERYVRGLAKPHQARMPPGGPTDPCRRRRSPHPCGCCAIEPPRRLLRSSNLPRRSRSTPWSLRATEAS